MKKHIKHFFMGIVTLLPAVAGGFGVATLFGSCADDEPIGDPEKAWAETTDVFESADEQSFSTFYTPSIGRVGDPMPFYDKKAGNFKVLYLQEFDDNADKRAYYCDKDQKYYIYYTGHNGNCTNREVVMRATSDDFKTWTKDNLWELNGPQYGYSGNDFRDPQIFVADDGLYHMVIATYPKAGGKPLFAEFKSADMRNWEHVGSFKMVWNDRMCECPDVFKMGNWWYLVFSEAPAWSRQVKYVMAESWESLKGRLDPPAWPDGSEDFAKLDSRAFYAGKTASDGKNRYIWGWCPTRDNYKTDIYKANTSVSDNKEPLWSGALVCHRVIQHADGKLSLANSREKVPTCSTTVWALTTTSPSRRLQPTRTTSSESHSCAAPIPRSTTRWSSTLKTTAISIKSTSRKRAPKAWDLSRASTDTSSRHRPTTSTTSTSTPTTRCL